MSTVVISPYADQWPAAFASVKEELHAAFAPVDVVVEHIGSTAVPGLVAKPVIDVLLGARALADVEEKIEMLARQGYAYIDKYERDLPMRRYFVKSNVHNLRVHLHAVELGSQFWRNHLTFRDALRADPGLAAGYAALKLRLAVEFANDKSAYTAAKAPFIQSALSILHAENDRSA